MRDLIRDSLRWLVLAGVLAGVLALAAVLLPPTGVAVAADDPEEIGSWHCDWTMWGSCPPDGIGRGYEDFWTWPRVENEKKIGVTCEIVDPIRPYGRSERCYGTWRSGERRILGAPFGATLHCPYGYVTKRGQCIEVEKPRGEPNCAVPAGSPINPATGEIVQTVTDWSPSSAASAPASKALTSTSPRLEFNRTYSSNYVGLRTPSVSRLGNAWRTNFDWAVIWDYERETTKFISIMRPDWTELHFGLRNGVWMPRRTKFAGYIEWHSVDTTVKSTLTVTPTTMTLREPDGTRYEFNVKGQLTQIAYPGGYTQTLTYEGDLNTRVSDSRGNWLRFVYGPPGSAWAGLLVVMQSSDGKLTRYSYEDRSSASWKQYAAQSTSTNQWALKSVTYPDTTPSITDNPRTIYDYLDNMYRPYLITTATNRPSAQPSTWSTTTWTYDVKKRVTSAERSIGKERWQYAYDDAKQQVTVTDPQRRIYTYARQISSEGLTKLSLLAFSRTSVPRSSPIPPPATTARSPIDDLLCKLTGKCSCRIDEKERCRVVTDHCIESCILAYDSIALQDLQSMYFQRCLAQCRFDYECPGGIDYPDDGWDQGKIGTPRPWFGK